MAEEQIIIEAMAHHDKGNLEEAEKQYRKAIGQVSIKEYS